MASGYSYIREDAEALTRVRKFMGEARVYRHAEIQLPPDHYERLLRYELRASREEPLFAAEGK